MKYALAMLLLWLAMRPAFAEESAASAFRARLAGNWQGTGEVNQMAADMRMTGAEGKAWHFKAQSYYRIEQDGTITGNWFESRGITLPLAGGVEQDSMTIQWGTEAIERGRSRYRLSAEGLEVTDEVFTKEGEWRTFGRTRLLRTTP